MMQSTRVATLSLFLLSIGVLAFAVPVARDVEKRDNNAIEGVLNTLLTLVVSVTAVINLNITLGLTVLLGVVVSLAAQIVVGLGAAVTGFAGLASGGSGPSLTALVAIVAQIIVDISASLSASVSLGVNVSVFVNVQASIVAFVNAFVALFPGQDVISVIVDALLTLDVNIKVKLTLLVWADLIALLGL